MILSLVIVLKHKRELLQELMPPCMHALVNHLWLLGILRPSILLQSEFLSYQIMLPSLKSMHHKYNSVIGAASPCFFT